MVGFTPQIFVEINGRNISDLVRPRLIEATLTDGPGIESDRLNILLDNPDDEIAMPSRGASIVFAGGYKQEGGPVRFGEYKIEDISKGGPKRWLSITARAAEIGDSFKELKSRAFEDRELGQILGQIASDHNLKPAVSSQLAKLKLPYRAQMRESDAHFLTWLGKRYNATATAKDGHLVFAPKGKGITVSGQALPAINITSDDLYGESSWTYTGAGRPVVAGARAYWHDPLSGIRRAIERIDKSGAISELTQVFQNESEAKDAIQGRIDELAQSEETLEAELVGRRDIQAESPLNVSGSIDKDASGKWFVETVEHSFSGSGIYTTEIQAKRGGEI